MQRVLIVCRLASKRIKRVHKKAQVQRRFQWILPSKEGSSTWWKSRTITIRKRCSKIKKTIPRKSEIHNLGLRKGLKVKGSTLATKSIPPIEPRPKNTQFQELKITISKTCDLAEKLGYFFGNFKLCFFIARNHRLEKYEFWHYFYFLPQLLSFHGGFWWAISLCFYSSLCLWFDKTQTTPSRNVQNQKSVANEALQTIRTHLDRS